MRNSNSGRGQPRAQRSLRQAIVRRPDLLGRDLASAARWPQGWTSPLLYWIDRGGASKVAMMHSWQVCSGHNLPVTLRSGAA